MKKNELVPVGNGESFTRCGWIRLALKTLFEDPHASFFVETIPLCVQLNLIVLLRLAIVGAFSLEIPRLFAVILGLFITTLIYSTSVAAKLWFLSSFSRMARFFWYISIAPERSPWLSRMFPTSP